MTEAANDLQETIVPQTAEKSSVASATMTKPVPDIKSEEDIPFPSHQTAAVTGNSKADSKLEQTDDLDRKLTIFRFETGKKVLYISMTAMGVAVAVDILTKRAFNVDSELVNNAFEAFKLITMTVLGYIFGSNSSK